eukprot:6449552-Pyramimonas_sp.AAC.1
MVGPPAGRPGFLELASGVERVSDDVVRRTKSWCEASDLLRGPSYELTEPRELELLFGRVRR